MKKSIKPLEEFLDSVRHIEGFPIGSDEDIIALSDPPNHTACPNPYISDFIEEYGSLYDEGNDDYHKEPFVGDISEGKTGKIYNAHSYHTKVPYKAITQYIKHFTGTGDLVFDGFCGSGMTGYACKETQRNSILADLSPIATFISSIYNGERFPSQYFHTAMDVLKEVEDECGWMYKTQDEENRECDLEYIVWSDVFICPYCHNEYTFFNAAHASNSKKVNKEFGCPSCDAIITKRQSERAYESFYDEHLDLTIDQLKQVPVLIVYRSGEERKSKNPDSYDLRLIEKINTTSIPYYFPVNRMPNGEETRRNDKYGYTHIHHFYTKRNLYALSSAFQKISKYDGQLRRLLLFTFEQAILGMSRVARYAPTHFSQVNRYLSGTLYVGSQIVEVSLRYILEGKIQRLKGVFEEIELVTRKSKNITTTQSSTNLKTIPSRSIDYIFTDPPFGSNLMYSELNYMWEQWSRVLTNNSDEAIINSTQNKGGVEYSNLMRSAFLEFYRVLKPNRWITVVFHNSKSEIWNILQDAIIKAGFVIAQVSVLDKQQSSFKQVTSSGAVKNDLVISAYKPKQQFQEKFRSLAGEGLEEDFLRMHLTHLKIQPTIERTEQMLYSKLLAYYVHHSYTVKYNSMSFFSLLKKKFEEIDGYWFTADQVVQYSEFKRKMNLDQIDEIRTGQAIMFIFDEKSALVWLNTFLNEPKDFQIIHPAFTKIATISGDNVPDIKELLSNNFIQENGKYRRPKDEEEKLTVIERREKELQREFDLMLLNAKNSRSIIKECRKQAIVYGFEQCYKNNKFQDILDLAARLDKKIIENDSEISEFIDVAELKVEGF
jgi:DNA modification methylase